MKEQKSLKPNRKVLVSITVLLSGVWIGTCAVAGEKMARLVEIDFPKPAAGFKLDCYDLNDEWIVWSESKLLDRWSRARRYRFEVFRRKVGEDGRDKLPFIQQGRDRPLVFTTNKGVALIVQDENLWLVPPDDKQATYVSGFDLRVFELFSDGLIAGVEEGNGRGRLVFCRITNDKNLDSRVVLEENFVTDGSVFDNRWPRSARKIISRCGTKVAWINGHPRRGEPNIVIGDIETGETKTVGKGTKSPHPLEIVIVDGCPSEMDGYPLEMDGLYGKWLLCHQGYLARLINIDDGRELQLPAPGRIIYFCPHGILFQVWGGPGAQCRLWDPVLEKRWDFIGDPAMMKFSIALDPNEEVARRYLSERSRVRYFTPADEMTEIPSELVADTAAATKACMDVYESEKDDTKADRTWKALFGVKWPYPPETIDAMKDILNSYKDVNVRRAAAQRIAFSNAPAARAILLGALKSDKDEFILVYLGLVCDKRHALRIIEANPRGGFAQKAADTLGILGHTAALEYLQSVSDLKFPLKTQEESVKKSVLNAIRYIEMRSEVESVLKSLRTVSVNRRNNLKSAS